MAKEVTAPRLSIPISIATPNASQPVEEKTSTAAAAKKPGGSKVAFIIVGVLALAAIGVASGWLLTQ